MPWGSWAKRSSPEPMGAGEEEERGWGQVPGRALPVLVVELPLVPGEMTAPGSEAGACLPGNAPGNRGERRRRSPSRCYRCKMRQDLVIACGLRWALSAALGAGAPGNRTSAFPQAALAPSSSGTAPGPLRCRHRHPSTAGLVQQDLAQVGVEAGGRL